MQSSTLHLQNCLDGKHSTAFPRRGFPLYHNSLFSQMFVYFLCALNTVLVLFRDGTRQTGVSILVLKSTPWCWERRKARGRVSLELRQLSQCQHVIIFEKGLQGPYKALSCYKEVSGSNSSDHHCQITGCSTPPLMEICKDAPPCILHTILLNPHNYSVRWHYYPSLYV